MTTNFGPSNDVSALPSPRLRRPGDLGTIGSQAYVVEFVAGELTWVPTGGGAAVVTQVFVGPGSVTVNDATDVMEVDPNGGAVVLTIPTLAARTPSRGLRIVQIGAGTIAIQGPDPIFAGTSEYVMSAYNDVVTLTPQTGGWRIASFVGAPRDFEVWVSDTGSDENVGTQAEPLLSVEEALTRAGTVRWRENMIVRVSGATLDFPNISVPGGLGSMAKGVEIRGENAVVATGTVDSVVAGTARTPLLVNVAGAPWASSAFIGGVVRFLDGPLAGVDLGVTNNGTGQLVTTRFSGAVPVAGNTFEIRMNATTLSGTFQEINSASGDRIKLTRVNVSSSVIAQSTFFTFEQVRWVTGGAFFEQNCDAIGGGGAYSVMFVAIVGSAALNLGSANMTNLALHNIAAQVFRDAVTVLGAQTFGTSRFTVRDDLRLTSLYAPATTLASGTNVVRNEGGNVSLLNASISNTTGDAAVASVGGEMRFEGVQGTGNASPCVETDARASILVVDPNTGTTITSGGADVRVGANAPVAWSAIATGLAASTTDLAAADSQMCRVGP